MFVPELLAIAAQTLRTGAQHFDGGCMTFAALLFMLLAGHALADYPLQGDFLAKAKNRAAPIPGVPWYQALGAHALIHGGVVALITGIWWLGLIEAAIHALTDDAKCMGRLSFNQDQAIHIMCKVLWAALAVYLLTPKQ